MAVDYKQKYMDLKAKFMSSLDVSYRMGYEQGGKDAQLQNLQQQQEMQQQQMMAMQQQMGQTQEAMEGQEGGGPMSPEEQADQFMQEQQQGEIDNGISELEAGIQELSDLLSKSEGSQKVVAQKQLDLMNKSLSSILAVREQQELKKNMDSIKKIGKAVKKVSGLSLSFKQNAQDHQKKALSMQKNIIDGIMNKWEAEEAEAAADILNKFK